MSFIPVSPKETPNVEVVRAGKESILPWRPDMKGYWHIKPFPKEGLIKARMCDYEHNIQLIIEGETPEEVYNEIVKRGLLGKMEHAAYLGKELHKAYVAMRLGIEFVQDSPLNFSQLE
jgi:hypothetical protein